MTTDDNLEKRLAVAEARVDAVRALADEHDDPYEGYRVRVHLIRAALDAVEPADQPHPTPEAGGYVVDATAPWARCRNPEPHAPHWVTAGKGPHIFMGGQCMGHGAVDINEAGS